MKISKETQLVLTCFEKIHQTLRIEEGNFIRTHSAARDIVCLAEVAETFPRECGIYDLREFLSCMDEKLIPHENLDVNFKDNFVAISDTERGSTFRLIYCDEASLHPKGGMENGQPTRQSNISSYAEFKMSKQDIKNIIQAAKVVKLPVIKFSVSPGSSDVTLTAMDNENLNDDSGSNFYSYTIPNAIVEVSEPVNQYLEISRLKIIPDDYNVKLCDTHIYLERIENSPKMYFWVAWAVD